MIHGKWSREDKLNMIRQKVNTADLLTLIAEEATELAQAALKLHRAYGYAETNPTSVNPRDAEAQFLEELADLELTIDVWYPRAREDALNHYERKMDRWMARLETPEHVRCPYENCQCHTCVHDSVQCCSAHAKLCREACPDYCEEGSLE